MSQNLIISGHKIEREKQFQNTESCVQIFASKIKGQMNLTSLSKTELKLKTANRKVEKRK